jgi:hypothetical protein
VDSTARGTKALVARARRCSGRPSVSDTRGDLVGIETDGGRARGIGTAEVFKSAPYLFWGRERVARLSFAVIRLGEESPAIGAAVAISPADNYESQHDRADGSDPSGLACGVAAESNDDSLPREWLDESRPGRRAADSGRPSQRG